MKKIDPGSPENNPSAILEAQIYISLRSRLSLLSFPKNLEALFEEHDLPERINRYIFLGFIGLVLYDLFIIGDRIMLPDIYRQAWMIRLFFVTPVCLAVFVLLKAGFVRKRADLGVSLIFVMISVSIMAMLLLSKSPGVIHYYTGIPLVIAYGNIIMRPRLTCAVIFSALICFLYALTVCYVDPMAIDVKVNSFMVLSANAFLTLAGNFYLRVEKRRDFLYKMLREIDAKKLEETNRILARLSIRDELTGLANRRHFDSQFALAWRRCMRSRKPLSVIFIDIDYFKAYNDYYGHIEGDRCLAKIAETLSGTVSRPGDLVARYGGEEFVILLDDTTMENSVLIAENIRIAVNRLEIVHQYSGAGGHVSLSLGVSTVIPSETADRSDLILYADKALYQAKESGRNRVCFIEFPVEALAAIG